MTKIQLRHDTATNWQTKNPILLAGEVGIETDTNKFKIGNGTDNYNTLAYPTGGEVDAYTKAEIDKFLAIKQDKLTAGNGLNIQNVYENALPKEYYLIGGEKGYRPNTGTLVDNPKQVTTPTNYFGYTILPLQDTHYTNKESDWIILGTSPLVSGTDIIVSLRAEHGARPADNTPGIKVGLLGDNKAYGTGNRYNKEPIIELGPATTGDKVDIKITHKANEDTCNIYAKLSTQEDYTLIWASTLNEWNYYWTPVIGAINNSQAFDIDLTSFEFIQNIDVVLKPTITTKVDGQTIQYNANGELAANLDEIGADLTNKANTDLSNITAAGKAVIKANTPTVDTSKFLEKDTLQAPLSYGYSNLGSIPLNWTKYNPATYVYDPINVSDDNYYLTMDEGADNTQYRPAQNKVIYSDTVEASIPFTYTQDGDLTPVEFRLGGMNEMKIVLTPKTNGGLSYQLIDTNAQYATSVNSTTLTIGRRYLFKFSIPAQGTGQFANFSVYDTVAGMDKKKNTAFIDIPIKGTLSRSPSFYLTGNSHIKIYPKEFTITAQGYDYGDTAQTRLNYDTTTLGLNENNQLTVIGGGGSSEITGFTYKPTAPAGSSPAYTEIRFADNTNNAGFTQNGMFYPYGITFYNPPVMSGGMLIDPGANDGIVTTGTIKFFAPSLTSTNTFKGTNTFSGNVTLNNYVYFNDTTGTTKVRFTPTDGLTKQVDYYQYPYISTADRKYITPDYTKPTAIAKSVDFTCPEDGIAVLSNNNSATPAAITINGASVGYSKLYANTELHVLKGDIINFTSDNGQFFPYRT